jgi:hypothetical protein
MPRTGRLCLAIAAACSCVRVAACCPANSTCPFPILTGTSFITSCTPCGAAARARHTAALLHITSPHTLCASAALLHKLWPLIARSPCTRQALLISYGCCPRQPVLALPNCETAFDTHLALTTSISAQLFYIRYQTFYCNSAVVATLACQHRMRHTSCRQTCRSGQRLACMHALHVLPVLLPVACRVNR